jgi:hypothetical protein
MLIFCFLLLQLLIFLGFTFCEKKSASACQNNTQRAVYARTRAAASGKMLPSTKWRTVRLGPLQGRKSYQFEFWNSRSVLPPASRPHLAGRTLREQSLNWFIFAFVKDIIFVDTWFMNSEDNRECEQSIHELCVIRRLKGYSNMLTFGWSSCCILYQDFGATFRKFTPSLTDAIINVDGTCLPEIAMSVVQLHCSSIASLLHWRKQSSGVVVSEQHCTPLTLGSMRTTSATLNFTITSRVKYPSSEKLAIPAPVSRPSRSIVIRQLSTTVVVILNAMQLWSVNHDMEVFVHWIKWCCLWWQTETNFRLRNKSRSVDENRIPY